MISLKKRVSFSVKTKKKWLRLLILDTDHGKHMNMGNKFQAGRYLKSWLGLVSILTGSLPMILACRCCTGNSQKSL